MSEKQEARRVLPHYTFSWQRWMKYKGIEIDRGVPEVCVGCGKKMIRYDYAMGICGTCRQEGKSPGVRITAEDQLRSWQQILARHGVPPKYRLCSAETWRGLWPLPGARWRGDPWCLYLWGETGVGKTHVATAIFGQWLADDSRGCLWTSVLDALKMLRESHAEGVAALAAYVDPKLLVLDELKVVDMTAWAREQVSYIIGRRYNEARATIVTSNHSPADLQEFDPTVISRLSEGIVLELSGIDHRQKGAR